MDITTVGTGSIVALAFDTPFVDDSGRRIVPAGTQVAVTYTRRARAEGIVEVMFDDSRAWVSGFQIVPAVA